MSISKIMRTATFLTAASMASPVAAQENCLDTARDQQITLAEDLKSTLTLTGSFAMRSIALNVFSSCQALQQGDMDKKAFENCENAVNNTLKTVSLSGYDFKETQAKIKAQRMQCG